MVLDHIGSIFILEVHMMWVFDIQCMGLVIAGDAITGQLGIFIRSFSRCTGIKDSTPPMGLFEHLIHSYIVLILINKHHFGGRPRLQTHPNKTKSNTQFAEFWFRDVMAVMAVMASSSDFKNSLCRCSSCRRPGMVSAEVMA